MGLTKRSHEGELFVDHRASPGLTDEQAIKLGYAPGILGEGKVFEAPTMGCNHCGTVVVINPKRTRDRDWCSQCDMYVCDNCALERRLPGYVHRTHRQNIIDQANLALIKGTY